MNLRTARLAQIETQILWILLLAVFRPLHAIASEFVGAKALPRMRDTLRNTSTDPLVAALRAGTVQYADGVFSGTFSAAISKGLRSFGGTFHKRSGTYHADPARIPVEVLSAATEFQAKAREAHERMKKALDEAAVRIDSVVDEARIDAAAAVELAVDDWKSAAKKLEVSPEISQEAKGHLMKTYTQSLKLPVKNFAKQEVVQLREVVEENAEAGYRFDTLIDQIKRQYGVAESKAKFLARQETSLFISKFREERFKDAGARSYRWATSHDERVRHSHKALDGTVQFFDNPPIVDPTSGRRANPGEDFMCRCVAIPILEPVAVEA